MSALALLWLDDVDDVGNVSDAGNVSDVTCIFGDNDVKADFHTQK